MDAVIANETEIWHLHDKVSASHFDKAHAIPEEAERAWSKHIFRHSSTPSDVSSVFLTDRHTHQLPNGGMDAIGGNHHARDNRLLDSRLGINILDRDLAQLRVIAQTRDQLSRSVLDLAVARLGLGCLGHRHRRLAVEVGPEDLVQAPPVGHGPIRGSVEDFLPVVPCHSDMGGSNEGGATAGIVLFQQGHDTGPEVDARFMSEAVGGGVFLQDGDIGSVAL